MATSKSSPTAGEVTQDDVPATTEPTETNFPAPVEETEPEPEPTDEELAKPGEVWAIYTGQQPSQRILRVEDLKTLGDKNATEPLVWDRNNRYRLEITDVHPMVLDYIEHQDSGFKVVRPE